MSTDYRMTVKRNKDNKEIAKFWCNTVKTIMDSEFAQEFGCPSAYYRTDKLDKKITVELMDHIIQLIKDKINKSYDGIQEKKNMIPKCVSVDVKHEIEDVINYIQENIAELFYVLEACSSIRSRIQLVTEDLIQNDKPAYEENGFGHDVYAILEAF